jgi:hypothetical protein
MKSEIEKAAEEYKRWLMQQIDAPGGLSYCERCYLAGARKLLELAEAKYSGVKFEPFSEAIGQDEHSSSHRFGDKRVPYITIDELRKLVEGEK